MSPIAFVTLCIVTFVALVGMFQITLVQDLITAAGYSTGEVFSGIATILTIFYFVLAIFTVRTR